MSSTQMKYTIVNVFELYNRIQNMFHCNSSLMHLIDIRCCEEYNKCHIQNAINIDMTADNQNITMSLKQIFDEKREIKNNELKIDVNDYNNDNNAWNDDNDTYQIFDEDEEYFYIYHGNDNINNNKQDMFVFIQSIIDSIENEYNDLSNRNKLIFHVLSQSFAQFYEYYPFLCTNGYDDDKDDETSCSYPNSILDNYLYLGGGGHANNYHTFKNLKITHCLNITKWIKCNFESKEPEIKYLQIKIDDRFTEDIAQYFDITHKFINNALYNIESCVIEKNPFDTDKKDLKTKHIKDRVVFVHCQGGVSRSSSIVISYLMNTKKMRLKQAMDYVSARRPVISPNTGFLKQLQQYERFLFGQDHDTINNQVLFQQSKTNVNNTKHKGCLIL